MDETLDPPIHPQNAFLRAEDRGWMEFGSAVLNSIGNFYSATNSESFIKSQSDLKQKFERIEAVMGDGPYFSGNRFSMVDVVFGPVFRYFDVIDEFLDHDIFSNTPKVARWREQLAKRASIQTAVRADYAKNLEQFIRNRNSVMAEKFSSFSISSLGTSKHG